MLASIASSTILAFALASRVAASPYAQHDHPHNPHHPQRELLKRSITANAATVNGQSFDFVIAGGGLAGLALAARLSEWSNVTVLVVEAGGDGDNVADQILIPGYSYLHSLTGSAYDWNYTTVPQTDSLGGVKTWPRGRGLGGSGAINGLFWCRGDQIEYDSWATLNPNGEQTWDWNSINSYINKAENFSMPNSTVQEYFSMNLSAAAHGNSGPIQSGFSEYIFDETKYWIPSWEALGFPNHDLADGNTRGVMITPSTINMVNQTRCDSKAGYIDTISPRPNLVILTGQQVTSVLFNGSTDSSGNVFASGVSFAAGAGAPSYSVQANKEVILSGGTIGSPQMLQLSGIGPANVLQPLGIQVVVNATVGYNLQDHVAYSMYWSTPQNTFTWGNLSRSTTLQSSALSQWQQDATGLWTYVNEAVGYPDMSDIAGGAASAASYAQNVQSQMSSTLSDVTSWQNLPASVAAGTAAQYALQQQWLMQPIGQLEIILTMLGQGDNTMGIQVALQHPWSRGTIFINSTSPWVQPLINPDYFGVGYDIDIMNYGSQFARTLAATAPLNTVMLTETLPGATVTGTALGNYTKQNCGTEYHPIGTCAMLPQASGGVVDTNLVVYGTNNIRVVDASIIPIHMSAHLMAVTYGIAEKGADIIKQKYWAASSSSGTNSTGSASTAVPGQATDASVLNHGKGSGSPLSEGAIIGIAVGAGVGALAILIAGIVFFCLRRKKSRAAPDSASKGWYAPGATKPRSPGIGGPMYKEPMYEMTPPLAPYHDGRARGRMSSTPSESSMATLAMASGEPMQLPRSGSGMGGDGGYGDAAFAPYSDRSETDFGENHYGYPNGQTPVRHGDQTYRPVRI